MTYTATQALSQLPVTRELRTAPSSRHSRRHAYRSAAFTLLEMLIVLVIIGILAGIVISLSQRVTKGGKYQATRNVLEVADHVLTEYLSQTEGKPPLFVTTSQTQSNTDGTDDTLAPQQYMFPIIDGRYQNRTPTGGPNPQASRFDKDADPAQPSGALLFLAITASSSGAEREFKAIDARFVQRRDVFAYGWLVDPNTGDPTGQLVRRRLRIPVLVDAFGQPIRFVHPGFQGGYGPFYNNASPSTSTNRAFLKLSVSRSAGQPIVADFTRSYRPFGDNAPGNPVGDADEGSAIGGHGYFYSSGADADPGTRQDNVYSQTPSFPPETAKLN